MEKTNFLRFLFLWVTLAQEFSYSSGNCTANSPDFLIRHRRVIDRRPNANTRVNIRNVPYVVNIKKNEFHACAGSILSSRVILTLASYVEDHGRYTVISGTLSTRGGIQHIVNGRLIHPQYTNFANNIALLSIEPPISFGPNLNQPISIPLSHNGQLPPNTLVTVSGFGLTMDTQRASIGCINLRRQEQIIIDPEELRSITLPTISLQTCRENHNHNPIITNDIICTSHINISTSPNERGNPLVFNGQLYGILVWDGFYRNCDLYVNVAFPEHRNWILANMSPANIPLYIPPPASPRQHRHRDPKHCSRIHPCNEEDYTK